MEKRELVLLLIGLCVLMVACVQPAQPLEVRPKSFIVEGAYYGEARVDKVICRDGTPISIEPIILKDNPLSQDISLEGLEDFLSQTRSKRDSICGDFNRDFGEGKPYYTCGYYVEEIHNDAEELGIRAGIVVLVMVEGPPHGLNIFETIDNGSIYVDGSYYADRVFRTISIGQSYEVWGNHHIVKEIWEIWEGYRAMRPDE